MNYFFFFQAEDGIRDGTVTGVQTCALPILMLVMASTGLIETWWVSRLGTDALAGIELVFPLYMMMQMLTAGAMGGGISSAIARALGGGRRADADALVLHAIVVNLTIGIVCSVLVLACGPALYRALGGDGASLD